MYCENVLIRNVDVETTGPNTDGLNPDSCRNVWIEGCRFSTGDDCIAVNSGMNEDGWRVGRPCENIAIVDCRMDGGHGALTIGSGMSGGVSNVYAAGCRIRDVMWGIRLKSIRGRGGYIRDVRFEDIVIEDASQEAVQISMFYPYSTVEPESQIPPEFSRIYLKGISGSCRKLAWNMTGLPDSKICDIVLSDISLSAPESMVCDNVERMEMSNVRF